MKQTILLVVLSIMLGACSSYGQGNDPAMRKVNMAMYAIENMYVDKVDENKLAEDAIVSLLEKLDPHSNYLTPEEVKEMNEPLEGNFDGIGVQFNMLTDTLYIIQVIPGGPSEKVGVKAGDRIIMVDDTLIAGVKMPTNSVMKRLKGPKGTNVTIKVLRQGLADLLTFRIVRDKIPVYSLDAHYMLDKETGYIKLSRFAATSHEEFVTALKKLQSQGMKNLIFDFQGNGGGYLKAAIDIADEFLKQNEIIVYTEGVRQKREEAVASSKGLFEKGKLIVLVDESSASASEIVAGAVQDWDRAVIVGRRSFGKGLVQRPIPLPDGSMIRLTTARYYTPTGRCIQKPYEKGNLDSYNKDLIDRYNHGEMMSADSIHFPDSLKYSTLVNHRTVYGGGGIMPDYFVPFDTTRYTAFHRNISAMGLINKMSMNMIDKNRAEYKKKYPTVDKFISDFTISDSVMDELLSWARQEKKNLTAKEKPAASTVKSENQEVEIVDSPDFNDSGSSSEITPKELAEFEKSSPLIRLQIKALIARDLWDMNEYYQIINQENESLRKAKEIIKSDKEYSKLLGIS